MGKEEQLQRLRRGGERVGGGKGVSVCSYVCKFRRSSASTHLHLLFKGLETKRNFNVLAVWSEPILQVSSRKMKDVSLPSLDVGVAGSIPARPFIPPIAAEDVVLEGAERLTSLNVIQ